MELDVDVTLVAACRAVDSFNRLNSSCVTEQQRDDRGVGGFDVSRIVVAAVAERIDEGPCAIGVCAQVVGAAEQGQPGPFANRFAEIGRVVEGSWERLGNHEVGGVAHEDLAGAEFAGLGDDPRHRVQRVARARDLGQRDPGDKGVSLVGVARTGREPEAIALDPLHLDDLAAAGHAGREGDVVSVAEVGTATGDQVEVVLTQGDPIGEVGRRRDRVGQIDRRVGRGPVGRTTGRKALQTRHRSPHTLQCHGLGDHERLARSGAGQHRGVDTNQMDEVGVGGRPVENQLHPPQGRWIDGAVVVADVDRHLDLLARVERAVRRRHSSRPRR